MRRGMTRWAICLRILCAVALLSVGLAHRPAVAGQPDALTLAQYVLPDGTLADLCIGDKVGGKAKHVVPANCEACRIGNAMLLPVPSDLAGIRRAFRHASTFPPVEEAQRTRRERPGALPRAPPFLFA